MKKIILFVWLLVMATTILAKASTPLSEGKKDTVSVSTKDKNEFVVKNETGKDVSVSLYTIVGKIIGNEITLSSGDEITLDMTTFKKGMYFVVFKVENHYQVKKIAITQ